MLNRNLKERKFATFKHSQVTSHVTQAGIYSNYGYVGAVNSETLVKSERNIMCNSRSIPVQRDRQSEIRILVSRGVYEKSHVLCSSPRVNTFLHLFLPASIGVQVRACGNIFCT